MRVGAQRRPSRPPARSGPGSDRVASGPSGPQPRSIRLSTTVPRRLEPRLAHLAGLTREGPASPPSPPNPGRHARSPFPEHLPDRAQTPDAFANPSRHPRGFDDLLLSAESNGANDACRSLYWRSTATPTGHSSLADRRGRPPQVFETRAVGGRPARLHEINRASRSERYRGCARGPLAVPLEPGRRNRPVFRYYRLQARAASRGSFGRPRRPRMVWNRTSWACRTAVPRWGQPRRRRGPPNRGGCRHGRLRSFGGPRRTDGGSGRPPRSPPAGRSDNRRLRQQEADRTQGVARARGGSPNVSPSRPAAAQAAANRLFT